MARKLGSFFSSQFFKAADVATPKLLTIVALPEEEVGREKELKLVVRFKDEKQGLVLNKCNSETISEIADTDDIDDWVGFQVVLFATTTDFAGRQVPCIRIRAPQGVAGKANARLREDRTAAAVTVTAPTDVAEEFGGDDVPF